LIDNRVAARVATHCCFAACEAPTMDFHQLALVPTHPRAHGQPPPGCRRTSRTTGTSQSCRPPHPRDLHTTCLPPKVSLLQTARPSQSTEAVSRREFARPPIRPDSAIPNSILNRHKATHVPWKSVNFGVNAANVDSEKLNLTKYEITCENDNDGIFLSRVFFPILHVRRRKIFILFYCFIPSSTCPKYVPFGIVGKMFGIICKM